MPPDGPTPDVRLLAFERAYSLRGFRRVAGVDEAGRGPLAGPVVAAAAVFHPDVLIEGIDDSKRVPERRREALFSEIMARALDVGVGIARPGEIDEINILEATRRAMARAIGRLRSTPDLLLVDGMRIPGVDIRQEAIVGGDARCRCIAGASIVAKVIRDRIMRAFDRRYPGYGFSRNKGYPTREHIAAIARLGVLPIHRTTYGPVRRLVEQRSRTGED
jgi:ribonuclease HII